MPGTEKMRGRRPAANQESGNAVTKAIDVMRAFIDGQESWGVRELANALGQPGSSIHRLLQILRREGLVEWDAENQRYRTGMEFFRWWAVLGRRLKIAELAQPLMAEACARLGGSCWLGLYDAGERRHAYIAEAHSNRSPRFNAPIGRYQPLWATEGGIAVLAFLEPSEQEIVLSLPAAANAPRLCSVEALQQIHDAGYVIHGAQDEDLPLTIGTPLKDARGLPVGSLTLAVPMGRYTEAAERRLGEALAENAGRLSNMIGSQMLGGAGVGTWQVGGDAITRLIQREIPGVGASAWSMGGDAALRDLQRGRGGYCFAIAESLRAAYFGESPYEEPHDRLRAMFSLFPVYLHVIVRRTVPAGSFRELRGLRLSAGERDFTTARVALDLIRRAGLVRRPGVEHRSLDYLSYPEANREFAAGKLDIVMSLTGLGDPSYRKLDQEVGIRLVPLDETLIAGFVAAHRTFERGVIPPSTYRGWEMPTATLMAPTVMVTTAHRSEDEIYSVTRAVYRERGELASALQAPEVLDPNFLFRGINVPLHPGAARFWREIGVLQPNLEIGVPHTPKAEKPARRGARHAIR